MRVNQPYDILKTYEGEELDCKGQLSHNPLLLSPNCELSHFHLGDRWLCNFILEPISDRWKPNQHFKFFLL